MDKQRPGNLLVFGGSRGIGAAIGETCAHAGWNVMLTWHRHQRRAERLRDALGQGCAVATVQADICSPQSVARALNTFAGRFGQLDCLVVSASGGMERDRPPDYAERINSRAPADLVRAALGLMKPGGRIIYLTSHEAHFSDRISPYPPYAAIALTKRQVEVALRRLADQISARGVALHIVSADLVEGTATAKLLEMDSPGHIAARRQQVGRLPTAMDVANHVLELLHAPFSAAMETSYVWEPGARYLGDGPS